METTELLGATSTRTREVTLEDCITFLGDAIPPSLSTPRMILWMEHTARDAVLPRLPAGEDSVGTVVNVRHRAAIPLGREVVYTAEVTAVEGRRITFRVEARHGDELVGDGIHERYRVEVARFAKGIAGRH
jgi:fluoroacetyl-CoA thioesterase